jgi:hypothetical protein
MAVTQKKLFVALTGNEILRESGRLPYPLLHSYVVAGYEVRVLNRLKDRLMESNRCSEADLPQPARLLLAMPGLTFVAELPADSERYDYLYDQPLPAADALRWRRRLRIAYDIFSAYHVHTPIIAPYAMYPAHLQAATPEALVRLRGQPRRMRAFFAGDSKGYLRNRVRYPAPKLPRQEVLRVLRAGIADGMVEVTGVGDIERLTAGGFVDRFVLSDSGTGIPQHRWLSTMASADFFLCPPGIVMPMCHNIIEAMAVGTIPLVGYPEWFHPMLEHGRNCIVFDTRESLVERVRRVLAMPDREVQSLRAEVIRYYEEHLRPGRVVETIEGRTEPELTILIHTELNMARNENKLGPRSVLITGPRAGGVLRCLGRALNRNPTSVRIRRKLSDFARRITSVLGRPSVTR